jgi:hypothetical protein
MYFLFRISHVLYFISISDLFTDSPLYNVGYYLRMHCLYRLIRALLLFDYLSEKLLENML